MNNESDDVADFQKLMFFYKPDKPITPIQPSHLQLDGIKHLKEETDEYVTAITKGDSAAAFDALIDIVYVAKGLAYKHGFPWNRGWSLVHSANMKKVAAPCDRDGKGGVIKPDNWVAPDLKTLVS